MAELSPGSEKTVSWECQNCKAEMNFPAALVSKLQACPFCRTSVSQPESEPDERMTNDSVNSGEIGNAAAEYDPNNYQQPNPPENRVSQTELDYEMVEMPQNISPKTVRRKQRNEPSKGNQQKVYITPQSPPLQVVYYIYIYNKLAAYYIIIGNCIY